MRLTPQPAPLVGAGPAPANVPTALPESWSDYGPPTACAIKHSSIVDSATVT